MTNNKVGEITTCCHTYCNTKALSNTIRYNKQWQTASNPIIELLHVLHQNVVHTRSYPSHRRTHVAKYHSPLAPLTPSHPRRPLSIRLSRCTSIWPWSFITMNHTVVSHSRKSNIGHTNSTDLRKLHCVTPQI